MTVYILIVEPTDDFGSATEVQPTAYLSREAADKESERLQAVLGEESAVFVQELEVEG